MPTTGPTRCAAVILDRDGTLIDFVRDPELGCVTPAFHPTQLRLLPGVRAGLRALHAAGIPLFVATNQPGAAKGQVPREAIERTNAALVELLAAEGIPIVDLRVCLHHPEGGPGGAPELIGPCTCRKPAPGLLLALAHEHGLEPSACWVIGDTAFDLRAARAARMRCGLLVAPGRCELCPLPGTLAPGERPDAMAERLDQLVTALGLDVPEPSRRPPLAC